MRCWQEQQLASHHVVYRDGRECDRDAVARVAATHTVKGNAVKLSVLVLWEC